MPALKDDKEEKLAQELAKNTGQALAWINAGFPAKNNNVAAVQCNRLLKKRPEINARVVELRAIARDEIKVGEFKGDVASLTQLLLEDRQFARLQGQAGACVSASSALAKLYKLGGDNPPGSPDNPFTSINRLVLVAAVSKQPEAGELEAAD